MTVIATGEGRYSDLERIIKSGDRVDFKIWIANCEQTDLPIALAVARDIQDFQTLVFAEMRARQ